MKKSVLIITSGYNGRRSSANLDGEKITMREALKLKKNGYEYSSSINQPYGKETVYIKDNSLPEPKHATQRSPFAIGS